MTQKEQIEKIRQEVERLKKENDNIKCDSNKAYCQGYGDAFVDLLPFFDTLQEPKNAKDYHKAFDELYGEHIPNLQEPEVDLKEEIEDFWAHLSEEGSTFEMIEETARHFYELGKNSK